MNTKRSGTTKKTKKHVRFARQNTNQNQKKKNAL